MDALPKNEALLALTDWQLHQACKMPVSFRSLAMSSTSRGAIAAGSGITSLQRKSVLVRTAFDLALTGVIEV